MLKSQTQKPSQEGEKMLLIFLQNLQENTYAWVSFFNKTGRSAILSKRDPATKYGVSAIFKIMHIVEQPRATAPVCYQSYHNFKNASKSRD